MCENFFHQILVFQHFYFFQVESEKRKRLVGLIQLIFLLLNIEINQVQFWTCENTSSAALKAINFKLFFPSILNLMTSQILTLITMLYYFSEMVQQLGKIYRILG